MKSVGPTDVRAASDEELWQALQEGDEAARAALITRYMAMARAIVRRLSLRVPPSLLDRGDLEAAAYEGLIRAVDRFEPYRQLSFRTYAFPVIHGAVVDSVRRLAPLSRQELQKRCAPRHVSLDAGLEDDGDGSLYEAIAGPAPNPCHELEMEEMRAAIRDAVSSLPERDRSVISLYYDRELELDEIGLLLGVSESRVSQIRRDAMRAMRETLALYLLA